MINQVDRAERNYAIKAADALERLMNNEDFKLIIVEGYCKDEPLRLASLLANDYLIAQGKRQQVMESLTAISYLDRYLNDIIQLKASAEDEDDEDVNAPAVM